MGRGDDVGMEHTDDEDGEQQRTATIYNDDVDVDNVERAVLVKVAREAYSQAEPRRSKEENTPSAHLGTRPR